jgi:hypothetical protein
MEFRKELQIKKMEQLIAHQDPILLMGSCFSEHIGARLKEAKFDVLENPHGILFNPISIARSIDRYLSCSFYQADDLFQFDECWLSWDHHSRFGAITPEGALKKMNDAVADAHDFLKKTEWVILTLGSAFIYELKASRQPVANCHRVPASTFHHRLLGLEEVLTALDNTIHKIRYQKKDTKFIFTVSPVRHLREGMIENNRSKAVLLQAVHHMVEKFSGIYYFPAYELVVDDLRDYRFYAEDMVHPNYQATEYVWEKMMQSCLDETAQTIVQQLKKIQIAVKHRPFHPWKSSHQQFLKSQLEATKVLQQQFPHLDLLDEKSYFLNALSLGDQAT